MTTPARHRATRRRIAPPLAVMAALVALAGAAVGVAAAQTPAPAPLSARAATDSCTIWHEQAAVFRQAYRLRLIDLARARHDSTLAVIGWRARADSLRVELRWAEWQAAALREDRPRWYESHDAGFAKGLVVALLAVWASGALK